MNGMIVDYEQRCDPPRRVPWLSLALWLVLAAAFWIWVQWTTRWWDWFDKGDGRPIWFEYPWQIQFGSSLAVGLVPVIVGHVMLVPWQHVLGRRHYRRTRGGADAGV